MSGDDLRAVVKKSLHSYARDVRHLDDVHCHQEALDYMARVDRVLSASSSGSLLMAGRTGAGRRTAVSVVAHANNMTLITPKTSPTYGSFHPK